MESEDFIDKLVKYIIPILAIVFLLYACDSMSSPSVPRYDMIDCEPVYTERGTECW